jgi:hypothetical protein
MAWLQAHYRQINFALRDEPGVNEPGYFYVDVTLGRNAKKNLSRVSAQTREVVFAEIQF